MGGGTDLNMNDAVFHNDDGKMLFPTGFHRVGDKGFHLFPTAHQGNACIVDHADQVAAVAAEIKLRFHYNSLLD